MIYLYKKTEGLFPSVHSLTANPANGLFDNP